MNSSYRTTPKLQTSDWREKMLSERDSGAYLQRTGQPWDEWVRQRMGNE